MSEPGLKCENNASFKLIYTLKLFIAFEMAYSCCFRFRGKSRFSRIPPKKFYDINYWTVVVAQFSERSLLKPEDPISNPVINSSMEHLQEKGKKSKIYRGWIGTFKTIFCSRNVLLGNVKFNKNVYFTLYGSTQLVVQTNPHKDAIHEGHTFVTFISTRSTYLGIAVQQYKQPTKFMFSLRRPMVHVN